MKNKRTIKVDIDWEKIISIVLITFFPLAGSIAVILLIPMPIKTLGWVLLGITIIFIIYLLYKEE